MNYLDANTRGMPKISQPKGKIAPKFSLRKKKTMQAWGNHIADGHHSTLLSQEGFRAGKPSTWCGDL